MIKKHWILRDYRHPDEIDLKALCTEFNEYNYNSVLFTVYPRAYDMWTRVAAAINDKHNFKYMMAVRPYLFSPQYLAMLISSFNKLSNDRLMINMVHGHLRQVEDFNGIMYKDYDLESPNERKTYLDNFLFKLINEVKMSVDFNIPEIIVSGQSNEILSIAQKHSANIALWDQMFIDNPANIVKYNFNKVYVSSYVIVANTDEEAFSMLETLPLERRPGVFLYGSKETVKNKIISLGKMGVTDIIFSQCGSNFSREDVHKFLNELTKEKILF